MANKTVKDARSVHGTNPQYLIEKIIRTRIYESRYWKEDCFALTADLVVDKGADLRYIGGIYSGNIKPTPFMCLTLKLLQLQPEKDIIIEFIRQENFKYIRALGAYYLRLTSNSLDVYKYLEPLYNDYRKLRRMTKMGTFDLIYMDEFVDSLLRDDRVFDVILPRLTKRFAHVENGELQPRVSLIGEDLELDDEAIGAADSNLAQSDDANGKSADNDDARHRSSRRSRSLSVDRDRHSRRQVADHHYHQHDDRDRGYRDRGERRRDRERSSVSPHSSRRQRDDGGRRSRSRDRNTHRDRHHRDNRREPSRSPDRSTRERKRRDERKAKNNKSEENSEKNETDEIAEMNALRAKLGLKPLKM